MKFLHIQNVSTPKFSTWQTFLHGQCPWGPRQISSKVTSIGSKKKPSKLDEIYVQYGFDGKSGKPAKLFFDNSGNVAQPILLQTSTLQCNASQARCNAMQCNAYQAQWLQQKQPFLPHKRKFYVLLQSCTKYVQDCRGPS